MRADLKRLKRDSSGYSLTCRYGCSFVRFGCCGAAIGGRYTRLPAETTAQTKPSVAAAESISCWRISLVMIGAGVYGFYTRFVQWRGDSGPIPFQNMSMEKLTNSGHVVLATISPDGKYVVNVVDEGQGQQSLWMRHVATGSNAQIMAPPEGQLQGTDILAERRFSLFRSRRCRNIPALDFCTRFRCWAARRASWWTMSTAPSAFRPTASRWSICATAPPTRVRRLIIAQADGTGERVLSKLPLPGYPDPAWSPDGKWIAATVLDPGSQNLGRVVLLNPETGKEKTVYAGHGNPAETRMDAGQRAPGAHLPRCLQRLERAGGRDRDCRRQAASHHQRSQLVQQSHARRDQGWQAAGRDPDHSAGRDLHDEFGCATAAPARSRSTTTATLAWAGCPTDAWWRWTTTATSPS